MGTGYLYPYKFLSIVENMATFLDASEILSRKFWKYRY